MPLGSIFMCTWCHQLCPSSRLLLSCHAWDHRNPPRCAAKLSLSQMPDCVLLVLSMNKHAKLIHHPVIDVWTPLNPNGREQQVVGTHWSWCNLFTSQCSCWTPSSVKFRVRALPSRTWPQQAADFISLVPKAGLTMRGSKPPFHGKRAIVLPPFLAKSFMVADMEDAAELVMVGCKNAPPVWSTGTRLGWLSPSLQWLWTNMLRPRPSLMIRNG